MFDGETTDFQVVKDVSVGESYSYSIDIGFLTSSDSAYGFTTDGCELECFGKFGGYDGLLGTCVPSSIVCEVL